MKRLEAGESPVDHTEQLTGVAAARERLVVGMRMLRGVNVQRLESSAGIAFTDILPAAIRETLVNANLIEISAGVCRLTHRGVMVSDGVAAAIL